ncbi:hypothetical protein FRACA_910017 [Frankia canadensis]|uniref:Uncharacterized protein n=1 Tax=Frankia canadensis TaxID=1836972 RepID=A0A2I2L2H6_9ACTN|nr:hypothetical protein [Frankia canadensis]SNQ52105.1 hypothetical protein FRACA_910017 [Frankia canadensis]SOU59395.1 hypothetical protein FRACA_910017 [Frankia canadensis]
MLAKVAVSAALFRKDISDGHWAVRERHRRITELLFRHAQIVCTGADEIRRLREHSSRLPRLVRPYWDPILFGDPHHFLVTPPPVGQKYATEISSRAMLRAWKNSVDVLVTSDTDAEHLGLNPHAALVKDEISGIEICRPTGLAESRLRTYVEMNGAEMAPSMDRDALWLNFIEPLYRPARQIVLIDRYAGNYIAQAEWLWKRMAEVPPPGDTGRTLTIFSGRPNGWKGNSRDVEWSNLKIPNGVKWTRGIAQARICWIPRRRWRRLTSSGAEVRLHDRHFRFDKRTLSLSSGFEWVAKLGPMECRLTYECKGDPLGPGFARLDRKEAWLRAVVAATPRVSSP